MEHDKLIEAMARAMENAIGESLIGSEFLATAALKALRDTLEPVGYEYRNPQNVTRYHPVRWSYEGWTETPLYALPEVKP
jgi:hypothetical protein